MKLCLLTSDQQHYRQNRYGNELVSLHINTMTCSLAGNYGLQLIADRRDGPLLISALGQGTGRDRF